MSTSVSSFSSVSLLDIPAVTPSAAAQSTSLSAGEHSAPLAARPNLGGRPVGSKAKPRPSLPPAIAQTAALTTSEAAAYLGVAADTLVRWRKQTATSARKRRPYGFGDNFWRDFGVGPQYLKLHSGAVRYLKADLDTYLARCRYASEIN